MCEFVNGRMEEDKQVLCSRFVGRRGIEEKESIVIEGERNEQEASTIPADNATVG